MSVAVVSMPATSAVRADRGVGLWLFAIAGLIGLMVVIGGLTRLTGSGLSITEWQPVTGVIPPLNDAAWQAEFAKYQGTPQYELLNRGMGLAGFKSIYWWEWTHRLLGRLLGVLFLVPFLLFLRQHRIDRGIAIRLAIIFLLGAAQGVLGWWMVQSGLTGARVAVSQYRLAAHLGLAMILFGYVFWTALEISGTRRTRIAAAARFEPFAIALVGLVFIQIILGAFMAGLDAGRAFSTWPSYAGMWIPVGLYDLSPWWINHFENHALVHFQHRTVGYIAAVMVIWLYVAVRRAGADSAVRIAGIHAVMLTALQIALGIFTVVSQVALPLAALHQICALGVFGAALWWAYALNTGAARTA
ncbi:MAG TPA: COX15/CtaA family protein [Micropepsaceae bacterium]|nr:COX15/CtaA family protein [Micropepsaceae bacterium]